MTKHEIFEFGGRTYDITGGQSNDHDYVNMSYSFTDYIDIDIIDIDGDIEISVSSVACIFSCNYAILSHASSLMAAYKFAERTISNL